MHSITMYGDGGHHYENYSKGDYSFYTFIYGPLFACLAFAHSVVFLYV